MRLIIASLIFTLMGIAPASARVRDAVLAIEGKTAISLVRFDNQPANAKVLSGPHGVEVIIRGVEARTARITPADPHLISAIDISPIEDGVRLLYHFTKTPKQGSIDIYERAIMLRAHFEHPLQAQKASLNFNPAQRTNTHNASATSASTSSHSSSTSTNASTGHAPAATPSQNSTPDSVTGHTGNSVAAETQSAQKGENQAPHNAPSSNAPGNSHQSADRPTHDGDVPAPQNHNPAPGVGMVRDASTTHTSQSLDKQSCEAAKKAIEDDPWAMDKLSLYAACIAKEGKTDEAKEVFERLLTFDPDMISAYMGLGAIAQERGDTAAAKRHYQQALDLGGSDSEAAQARAMLGTLGNSH